MPYYPAARSETYDRGVDAVKKVAGLWRGERFVLHRATNGSIPSAPPTVSLLLPGTSYDASAGWTYGFLFDGFEACRVEANVSLSGAAEIRLRPQVRESAGGTYVDVHRTVLAGPIEYVRPREYIMDASGRQTFIIEGVVGQWIRFRTMRVNGAATSAPAIELAIQPFARA